MAAQTGAAPRRVRRFFIALGTLCLLSTLFAALVLRGVVKLNTPSRADFPIWGVDVSHYQGEIDWEALAAQGVRFAFIKATEGSGHVDERFFANARGAAAAGIPAGGYHFFSFESAGETQAENFLAALRGQPLSLPCVVDLEFYGEFFDHPPDVEETRAELRVLLEALEEAAGQTPILYATQRSYRMYLEGAFDEYPLWLRDVYLWPALTLPGRDWTFWQYSDKGRLEGYEGEEEYVDLNVFGGGEEAFARWLEQA